MKVAKATFFHNNYSQGRNLTVFVFSVHQLSTRFIQSDVTHEDCLCVGVCECVCQRKSALVCWIDTADDDNRPPGGPVLKYNTLPQGNHHLLYISTWLLGLAIAIYLFPLSAPFLFFPPKEVDPLFSSLALILLLRGFFCAWHLSAAANQDQLSSYDRA